MKSAVTHAALAPSNSKRKGVSLHTKHPFALGADRTYPHGLYPMRCVFGGVAAETPKVVTVPPLSARSGGQASSATARLPTPAPSPLSGGVLLERAAAFCPPPPWSLPTAPLLCVCAARAGLGSALCGPMCVTMVIAPRSGRGVWSVCGAAVASRVPWRRVPPSPLICTAHSTQHTAHSTQHTAHSTRHTAHSTRTVHQCVMSRVTHEKRSEPFFRTRVCKNPEPPTTAARLSVSPHPAIALGLYVPGI